METLGGDWGVITLLKRKGEGQELRFREGGREDEERETPFSDRDPAAGRRTTHRSLGLTFKGGFI